MFPWRSFRLQLCFPSCLFLNWAYSAREPAYANVRLFPPSTYLYFWFFLQTEAECCTTHHSIVWCLREAVLLLRLPFSGLPREQWSFSWAVVLYYCAPLIGAWVGLVFSRWRGGFRWMTIGTAGHIGVAAVNFYWFFWGRWWNCWWVWSGRFQRRWWAIVTIPQSLLSLSNYIL